MLREVEKRVVMDTDGTAPIEAQQLTVDDYERAVTVAAREYPQMWREDPAEVRSAVGWALATGRRPEWVLNSLYQEQRPVGRSRPGPKKGRVRSYVAGTRPVTVSWDGRSVEDGVPEHTVQGLGHTLEWADPTGETAARRVDAARVLGSVHPDYRQALWASACGGTPAEIAEATGRPLSWVKNVVYRSQKGPDLFRRSAADQRRAELLEAAAAGLRDGRSLRSVAGEVFCSPAVLAKLWRAHCDARDEGVAA